MAFLRNIWNFDQTKSPSLFYSRFDSLNHFFDTAKASPEILKELQIKNLKAAYLAKGNSYAVLNKFIKDLLGDKQGTEEDLFAKLAQGINKGLDEFRSSAYKQNPNWVQERKQGIYYEQLDELMFQLNSLVNQITGENGVPGPSLDPIKNAIRNHNKADFIAAKGQFLEDIGSWIMERAGLSGFTTGSWQATDRFFGETAQASIIEDAMGLLLDGSQKFSNSSVANNFLQVKIQNYNQKGSSAKAKADKDLQDWIDSIEGLNNLQVLNGKVVVGTNIGSPEEFARLLRLINNNPSENVKISISLSDNLYQEIRKLSVNIQAKSNIERHLANAGNRSLYHINSNDKYYNQLLAFSQTEPVINKTAVSEEEQNTPYEEFSAYVNYNLSKNINNTVYGRNEYYITTEGFTDLATLMEKRDFYIRISDAQLSYRQFLINSFRTTYI